jgi:hypothetical protein
MSTRVIASIGVMLCLVMTAFSIYLGVAEHVYSPHKHDTFALSRPLSRDVVCSSSPRVNNTATSSVVFGEGIVPCHDPSRIVR